MTEAGSDAYPGMQPGNELAGKVALVTGAGRNIGRAIARSLSAGGASIVVCARTSAADARETCELIIASGGKATAVLGDLTVPAEVERVFEEARQRFGRLDILVNNAAVRLETPLLQMSFEEWQTVLGGMLDSTFLCTKAALPMILEAGGGAIVNIGGQTGHDPVADRAHVVTAKAGIAGFTRAVATEYADRNITVNCVVPGSIDTVRGASAGMGTPPPRAIPPVGRLGSPWEIAAMVRLLVGPSGRFITGQTIHINGGGYMP